MINDPFYNSACLISQHILRYHFSQLSKILTNTYKLSFSVMQQVHMQTNVYKQRKGWFVLLVSTCICRKHYRSIFSIIKKVQQQMTKPMYVCLYQECIIRYSLANKWNKWKIAQGNIRNESSKLPNMNLEGWKMQHCPRRRLFNQCFTNCPCTTWKCVGANIRQFQREILYWNMGVHNHGSWFITANRKENQLRVRT